MKPFSRKRRFLVAALGTAAALPWLYLGWTRVRPPATISLRTAPATRAVVGPNQSQLDGADTTADWLYATHGYQGQRFSKLASISTANVRQLRERCVYEIPNSPTLQTNPLVYDGRIFVTSIDVTAAIDAVTCEEIWKLDRKPHLTSPWPTNRGAAIAHGLIVRGTGDGYLLALDAATGSIRWQKKVADAEHGELFTMPPLIYDDLVIIGPAGSENMIRGWVGAFRLRDGEWVWRFNTFPDSGASGASTWLVPDSADAGGAAIWTPLTLDQSSGLVFVPTANPAPDLISATRGGANLYSNSVVAIEARSGKPRWFRQIVPADTHDWDQTHAGPLISAGDRLLVIAAGKDGYVHALDRSNGTVLWSTPVSSRSNVEAKITEEGTHVCPGIFGGILWNGPAFSPLTRMLYVPSIEWCGVYHRATSVRRLAEFHLGIGYEGGWFIPDSVRSGHVTALDAVSGKVKWRYESRYPMVSAITATAGGLVFTGEMSGELIALDANTGALLNRVQTGGGMGGGIVTYAVNTKQFVAVTSGGPSRTIAAPIAGPTRIIVYEVAQ